MPILRLPDLHARHVERIMRRWVEAPSTHTPDDVAFKPLFWVTCRDRKERTLDRVRIAPSANARKETALDMGWALARDGLRPYAATHAAEMWIAPADSGSMPANRPDRRDVLAMSTAQADGRSLTTILTIVRSEGGEPALGVALMDTQPGLDASLVGHLFDAFRTADR